ncbi:MAG: hypothetical protein ACOC3W_11450 [Thermodesulfobacteriota bacterium]
MREPLTDAVPRMNIRYLIVPLTTRCNLACAYCYSPEFADAHLTLRRLPAGGPLPR